VLQRDMQITIERPNLIICEGKDDKTLLEKIIKNIGQEEYFQVQDVDGVNKITAAIKTIRYSPNFETLKSITIIRDSDNNAVSASLSVQGTFKNSGFPVPNKPCSIAISDESEKHRIKTAYTLFPGFNDVVNGTLEDLCLSILNNIDEKTLDISKEAIEKTINEVGKFKRESKNRLYTYLSLTDDYVETRLSLAIEKGVLDINASELEPIKRLLVDIVN